MWRWRSGPVGAGVVAGGRRSRARSAAAEDEDCRWVTLKAMDYIGGAEADALVKGAGLADKDGGPRRLAEKIAGAKGK